MLHVPFGDAIPPFDDHGGHETEAWALEFLRRHATVPGARVRLVLEPGAPSEAILRVADARGRRHDRPRVAAATRSGPCARRRARPDPCPRARRALPRTDDGVDVQCVERLHDVVGPGGTQQSRRCRPARRRWRASRPRRPQGRRRARPRRRCRRAARRGGPPRRRGRSPDSGLPRGATVPTGPRRVHRPGCRRAGPRCDRTQQDARVPRRGRRRDTYAPPPQGQQEADRVVEGAELATLDQAGHPLLLRLGQGRRPPPILVRDAEHGEDGAGPVEPRAASDEALIALVIERAGRPRAAAGQLTPRPDHERVEGVAPGRLMRGINEHPIDVEDDRADAAGCGGARTGQSGVSTAVSSVASIVFAAKASRIRARARPCRGFPAPAFAAALRPAARSDQRV